jgi:hypothetical protein
MNYITHLIKTFTHVRHSKLDLESSGLLDAVASLTKSILPCGMDAIASFICWIPNQVWNDGKAFA